MARKIICFLIVILIALLLPFILCSEEGQKIEKKSLYCYKCGQENAYEAKFCKACGTQLISIDPSRYVKNFKKQKKFLDSKEKQLNINRASKAVVRVKTKTPVHYRKAFFGDWPKSGRYDSNTVVVQELESEARKGAGSGFFISPDGYIVTNAHVATPYNTKAEIEVETYNGETFDAHLIGSDAATDIAVLKIETKSMECLKWIDPDNIEVAEELWAIGNPLDIGLSTTKGILSSRARLRAGIWQIENFISIDAQLTYGNSGGPAVDCFGNVVGVNNIKMGKDEEALNYCISSTIAKKVAEDFIDDGKLSRSFIGLGLSSLDDRTAKKFNIPYSKGVVVEYIVPESPAEATGFLPGDLIFDVNDELSLTTYSVQNEIIYLPPGSRITIKFMRGQATKVATITTIERPEMPRIAPIQDLERHLGGEFKVDDKGNVIFANIDEYGLAARLGLKLETNIKKFFPMEFWEVRDKDWNKIQDAGKPIKIDSLENLSMAISKSYLNERIAFLMEGKDIEGDRIFFPIIIIESPMIIA